MPPLLSSSRAYRALLLKIRDRYHQLFGIEEIEHSQVLQWMFGAMLFFFFITFSNWIGSSLTTIETAAKGTEICWPYFQDCGRLYFLERLPNGYSQSTWYMGLYSILIAVVYLMWRKKWTEAHALLLMLFVWKVFVGFVLSYSALTPYDYYHLILTAVLLFLPYKEYFLRIAFVLLYFVSGTIKIDSTWTLGTYFTTLKTGLPLFPTELTPVFTNLVIFMQIVGAWFLLSKHPVLQRGTLLFFVAFHLYSGIFVLYTYPSIALPPLLILFGPLYRPAKPPLDRKSVPGWMFMGLIIVFQIPGMIIPLPGDRRLSLEGNHYGMFMFEANHQCAATIRTYRTDIPLPETKATTPVPLSQCTGRRCLTERSIYAEDGQYVTEERIESGSAWYRCDPYTLWSQNHRQCARDPNIARIAVILDHSINGEPFYRIVDVPDMCSVGYKPFSHNEWIRTRAESPIVGYPMQNVYRY